MSYSIKLCDSYINIECIKIFLVENVKVKMVFE